MEIIQLGAGASVVALTLIGLRAYWRKQSVHKLGSGILGKALPRILQDARDLPPTLYAPLPRRKRN